MTNAKPVPIPAFPQTAGDSAITSLQQAYEWLQAADAAQVERAIRFLESLLIAEPTNGWVHMGLGIGCARQGRLEVALQHMQQAVQVAPKLAPAWVNLGNLHRQRKELKEARHAYERAIGLQSGYAEAHYNLAVVLDELGQQAKAVESVRRALMFKPDYADAHNNMGHLLVKQGRVEDALTHFRQALVWAPELHAARFNLILALYRLGRHAEANAEVKVVLAQDPENTKVLRVQAAGLMQMGQLSEADAVNRRLLELEPGAVDLMVSQAEMLVMKKDYAGARDLYQKMLQKGHIAPALGIGALANLMRAQGHYAEAAVLYRQALLMDNRLPQLVLGHSRVLIESGELPLGRASLDRAVELLPNAVELIGLKIAALRLQPDVTLGSMQAEVDKWRAAAPPALLELASQHVGRPSDTGTADFRVGFLLGPEPVAELLDSLGALADDDDSTVRYFLYPTGAGTDGIADLKAAQLVIRPVAGLGDADIVQQVRQDAVDILIDTTGCGWGNRLPVLWARPAPALATWLGEGVPQSGIPMLTGDGIVNQAKSAKASKVLLKTLQPHFYWKAPDQDLVGFSAAQECAPTGGLVFGVLAPLSHINGQVLDTWADLLTRMPLARLVVSTHIAPADEGCHERLRRLFILRDIDPGRLEFAGGVTLDEQLAVLPRVDVVLDTFPANMSPTLVLNCVWHGVPVLAVEHAVPWGRTTAWVLRQAGMDSWVTQSPADYVAAAERLAVSLAGQRLALSAGARRSLHEAGVTQARVFARQFRAACKSLAVSAP